MNILDVIQQRGIEAIGRFYSSYRGIVVSNKDPDHQNKICVYLPNILQGVEAWAYPKDQQGGPGFGMKGITPKEGAIVYVEFENGDPRHPLWTYHGWAIGEIPDDLDGNDILGIVTPKGNKIILDESETGILTLRIASNINIESLEGDINITSSKNKIIMQGGEVGVPESTSVTEKLNTLEKDINKLKKVFSGWSPVPQDGGSALKAQVSSWASETLTETKVEDIESETIKQPN